MRKILLIIVCVVIFVGCDKDEVSTSNKPLLREKFDGIYEIISSVSDKAVDLNNDGYSSKNLLNENSMILFSSIEIMIPAENEFFLKDNAFIFSEFWPTENEHRLKCKEIITVYKTRIYSGGYDIYGNALIGKFADDLNSGTFAKGVDNDGKNTLIAIKSFDIMEDETIKLTVVRMLFTTKGWITTEIESLYKRYTSIT